jgi:hypothetical protein
VLVPALPNLAPYAGRLLPHARVLAPHTHVLMPHFHWLLPYHRREFIVMLRTFWNRSILTENYLCHETCSCRAENSESTETRLCVLRCRRGY